MYNWQSWIGKEIGLVTWADQRRWQRAPTVWATFLGIQDGVLFVEVRQEIMPDDADSPRHQVLQRGYPLSSICFFGVRQKRPVAVVTEDE